MSMDPRAEPTVLQTDPETFEVWVGPRRVRARLAHHTRRGLGLQGVPPVAVAGELVRFLVERDALPEGEVDLGPTAGRFPELAEEMRARLA
jgi:hypothetical protein